jgi:hypothetical protein
MNCYLVKVKTTNSLHDTWELSGGEYCRCQDGEFYFIGKDRYRILQIVGDSLISITRVGYGYRDEEFTRP